MGLLSLKNLGIQVLDRGMALHIVLQYSRAQVGLLLKRRVCECGTTRILFSQSLDPLKMDFSKIREAIIPTLSSKIEP